MFQKQSPNYLEDLMDANNEILASMSNFKMNTINLSDYQTYLSEEGDRRLESTLRILKERMDKDMDLKRKLASIQ
jgi:hypothetical protein